MKKRKKFVSAIAIFMAVLMLLSLVFSVVPVTAYADELDDLRAQLESDRDACLDVLSSRA